MAREHANIQVDIWNDPDFRELTSSAQLLYLQLLSSATLTYAGVADWRPKRIALLSQGRSLGEVESAMRELEDGLYVVVDEDSEEVFVRSFFKWDGLMQKPNVAKAMVTAWGKVHSLTLKGVIVHEVERLRSQFPEWRAFEVQAVQELCEKDSLNPSDLLAERVRERVPLGDAVGDAPLLTTNYLLPTTELLATSSALSAHDFESLFDDAYSHWPRKTERKKSFEKFKQSCKGRDPHKLVADIVRFGDAYAATTEVQFVPALVVWLNGERWTDDLPSSPKPPANPNAWMDRSLPSKADEANDFINRLEAIDATRGGGEAARDYPQLR